MLARLGEPIITIDPAPLGYLWAALRKMGPARATSMGIEAWDWVNIQAFAAALLPLSEPWEIEALRAMSQAYVAALHSSGDVLSLSPVQRELGDDFMNLLPAWSPGESVMLTLPELD